MGRRCRIAVHVEAWPLDAVRIRRADNVGLTDRAVLLATDGAVHEQGVLRREAIDGQLDTATCFLRFMGSAGVGFHAD